MKATTRASLDFEVTLGDLAALGSVPCEDCTGDLIVRTACSWFELERYVVWCPQDERMVAATTRSLDAFRCVGASTLRREHLDERMGRFPGRTKQLLLQQETRRRMPSTI